MAETRSMTVTRSILINTGNYENITHSVTLVVDIDPFEDVEVVEKDMDVQINKMLMGQLVNGYKARGKKMSEQTISRHHGLYNKRGGA